MSPQQAWKATNLKVEAMKFKNAQSLDFAVIQVLNNNQKDIIHLLYLL